MAARPGVHIIDTRTQLAYGLILLLLLAAVVGVFYARHNTHDRKIDRRRERERVRREEQDSAAP